MADLRTLAILCRISNLPTVFANVLAAWFLGGGAWGQHLAWSALAAALCYSGGMILNDVFDAEWDRLHQKPRPIPQAKISRIGAACWGWAALGLGAGSLFRLGAHPAWVAGLVCGIVSYNGLHKQWPGSIWLMGACRFFLFLAVASIPGNALSPRVWLWGIALAFYVAGITLAAQREETSAWIPPGTLAFLLLPAGCALYSLPPQCPSLARSLLVLLAFGLWLFLAYRRLHQGRMNTGPFVSQLLAGMVLVDAMALSAVFPLASLLCLLLLPVNLLLQAFVPPT